MALDWSNERYVRVYTRDTTTWKLVDWRARTVLLHLFRKVDRAGVIDVGEDGTDGVAAVLELPTEIVEPGLDQLVKRGTVVATESAFVLPNFLEAQEAPASDRQRQREARDKRRAISLGVTIRDGSSRNVTDRHERSHGVTERHTASQHVTPSLAVPCRTEPSLPDQRERDAAPATPALLSLVAREPAKPDPIADLWAEQERLRAESIPTSRRLALTADRRKKIAALLKSGHTADDLRACLTAYAAEARTNGGEWFNGESNWVAANVARTLGRIGTTTTRAPPAQPATGRAPPAVIDSTETWDPRTITPRTL